MTKKAIIILLTIILILLAGCERPLPELSDSDKAAADTLDIDRDYLRELKTKPLFKFSEEDLDTYLPYLQYTVPDIHERMKHLSRKGLDQPYEIYLLGEYPAEIYDRQPLYILDKSDCVVFTEHILAMSMAHDWQSFFSILQRIRYKDGIISYINRNHYGGFDWGPNNTWLADNITKELAGDLIELDTMKVNKGKFFAKRGVPYNMPEDSLVWSYVPIEAMPQIVDKLETGDLIGVVRGYKNNRWIGHFGMIIKDDDGTVYMLHSTPPKVIQQPYLDVLEKVKASNLKKEEYNAPIEVKNEEIKAFNKEHKDEQLPYEQVKYYTLGYRFLRVKEDPLASIMKEGQELRLKVVPVYPDAIKTSKRDSVLQGLYP
ncbi:MAG: DUF1460 domain-containing protein [Candidatus Marinimicrobia bacterium]|nr:DUF1460 domain-containing protein [Candidatus Neomarinimicrobiota bacterium]